MLQLFYSVMDTSTLALSMQVSASIYSYSQSYIHISRLVGVAELSI